MSSPMSYSIHFGQLAQNNPGSKSLSGPMSKSKNPAPSVKYPGPASPDFPLRRAVVQKNMPRTLRVEEQEGVETSQTQSEINGFQSRYIPS